MNRFVLTLGCVCLAATPALATNEFSKEWKAHYMNDQADDDFVRTARRAGCNVCHIKGEKKEMRNEYGQAAQEFLDKEKFTREWVKENPEEATRLIVAGLKKAGEKSSSDGRKFADKLKAGELPAVDAGL